MNAPRPPLPASLSRAEAEHGGDIDQQILQVEYRLIAREENLRRGIATLGTSARESLQPKRLLVPAGGALLGLVALVSLFRRPRPSGPSPAANLHAEPASGPPPRQPIPWAQVVGLVWPMLPDRWRDRINPTTLNSMVMLGQPLLDHLFGGGGASNPLTTMPEVDLLRLAGRWFIVGELAAPLRSEDLEAPEMGLLPRDDGQFDLLQRRITADGAHGSEARVQPVPGSHGARLRVSRWPEALQWLSQAWVELGVLHVDETYGEALIGSTRRDTLWVMSRSRELDPARRQALTLLARDRGFATEKLHFY